MDYEATAHRSPYRVQMADGKIHRVNDLGEALELATNIACTLFMDGYGNVWFDGDQRDPECDLSGLEVLADRQREHEHDVAHFEALAEEQEARFEIAFGKDWM